MCRIQTPRLDTKKLRQALGSYPTGVAVVTAAPRLNKPVGITINSFSSISLNPALVSWCLDLNAESLHAFSHSQTFTLSVLERSQRALAQRFATRGADKFADIATDDPDGPVIPGACAWLRCRSHRQLILGDHLMLVGEVTSFAHGAGEPLIFSRGRFGYGVTEFGKQAAA